MQGTPVKQFASKNSSLRAQIQSKLLTDKKFDENKENLKKYHSHIKSVNQNNFFSCSNSQISQHQLPKQFKQDERNHALSQINEKTILQYESLENPKFFGYTEWLELNQKFFSKVDEKYIKILWKIMRTINYGDVLIPSGLIFQVAQCLNFQRNTRRNQLKNVFNNFLQINNVADRVNNFRELKNYPSLQEVQEAYNHKRSIQKEKSCSKKSICEDLTSMMSEKNVFDRNYQVYKSRNLSKNRQILKRQIEKQKDSQCLFHPKLSEYCPKNLFIDQTLKFSRDCHSHLKQISQKLTNNDITQNFNFKATPFQRSRIQNQGLQNIPGATQHINRCKYSQAKKRKLQRYSQKPTQVFKNY